MSTAVSYIPQGVALGRLMRALKFAKNRPHDAIAYVEGAHDEYKSTPEVVMCLKSAVTAMTTGDSGQLAAARAMGALLLPLVRNNTLIDRLATRKVPLNIIIPTFTNDANAHNVAEGIAKPLSRFSFASITVSPKKIVADIAMTDDVLKMSDPVTDAMLGAELAKACIARSDFVFADPNVGGSISNGAMSFSSSGSTIAAIDADLKAALNLLAASGDEALTTAVWAMSSKTAIWISTLRATNGNLAYPTVTAKGGTLFGVPILTSGALVGTGSPTESAILLIDANQILVGDPGAVAVSVTNEASIQLDDAPSSSAAQTVGLFQANLSVMRAERWIGWARRTDSSVIAIDDINFAA